MADGAGGWAATIGYREFIRAYIPAFFSDVAQRLHLAGTESLLDLGCGAGEVAFGFGPYVDSLTGIDSDPEMLEAARRTSARTGVAIRLIGSRVEEAPPGLGEFDLVTLGRSHWYFEPPVVIARIKDWLRPGGRVLICTPSKSAETAPWNRDFMANRKRWKKIKHRENAHRSISAFFRGSGFELESTVESEGNQTVTLEHLVSRALGYSSTSRTTLGDDTPAMINDIRTTLAPYFVHGAVVERQRNLGAIFRRGNFRA